MTQDMPEVIYAIPDKYMDRFQSRIDKTGECWNWTAHKLPRGYGYMSLNGRAMGAHRISYMMYVGPLESGKVVHHICENPSCVNPKHLTQTTQRVNTLISNGATAKNYNKIKCINGHDLDGNNVKIIIRKDGIRRKCRVCERIYKREKRELENPNRKTLPQRRVHYGEL